MPKKGQNPKAYSARLIGVVETANDRLRNDAAFYGDVRRDFGNPGVK